jgi:hypothetical protein
MKAPANDPDLPEPRNAVPWVYRSNARFREQRNGPLAQLAEQQTLNLRVLGSIPRRLTIFLSNSGGDGSAAPPHTPSDTSRNFRGRPASLTR